MRRNGRNIVRCGNADGQNHRQGHILQQEAPEPVQCPHSIRLSKQNSLPLPQDSLGVISGTQTPPNTFNLSRHKIIGRGRTYSNTSHLQHFLVAFSRLFIRRGQNTHQPATDYYSFLLSPKHCSQIRSVRAWQKELYVRRLFPVSNRESSG